VPPKLTFDDLFLLTQYL